jgi:hypothetical protein
VTPLTPILALARSGATQRAWEAFVAAGLERTVDVNALTLKGRLLKDRARQAKGPTRSGLFAQSGAAYAAAARLRPDSYPLINAAAMALFGGDGATASALARDTLTLVDGDPAQGETPYWREATRAEALLLLGRTAEAQASLTTAIKAAPLAYEDHAATLRQFAAILAQTGSDAAWLDAHRPPPNLHYRGILGISADDTATASAIHGAVAEIAPGFAYGALAAGADILVAEAVLRLGGELHVVLPADVTAFRQSSVLPYGADWGVRFDALIDHAHSLTLCAYGAEMSHASVRMAEYQAMGMAAQRASLLESRAVGLRIEPETRATDGDPWLESGRSIRRVAVPETAGAPPANLPDGNLLFLLALAEDAQIADAMGFSTLARAIAAIPPGASTAALDCTIGQSRDNVAALLRNATPGSITATASAAMALMAERRCSRIEPLGEMDTGSGAVAVYAVQLKDRS